MTPERSYIVASAPRTGSYLLCEGLETTGVAGRPTEVFSPHFQEVWRNRWELGPGSAISGLSRSRHPSRNHAQRRLWLEDSLDACRDPGHASGFSWRFHRGARLPVSRIGVCEDGAGRSPRTGHLVLSGPSHERMVADRSRDKRSELWVPARLQPLSDSGAGAGTY